MMDVQSLDNTWIEYRRLVLDGLERIDRELVIINTKIDLQDKVLTREIADLRVEIGMLKVKAAIMATVSSIVTSAIVGAVVAVLMHK